MFWLLPFPFMEEIDGHEYLVDCGSSLRFKNLLCGSLRFALRYRQLILNVPISSLLFFGLYTFLHENFRMNVCTVKVSFDTFLNLL